MVNQYHVATGKWGMAAQIWRSVNQHIWLIEVRISDVLYTVPSLFHCCPCRLLVGRARRIAQQYQLEHNESIPVSQLVQKLATVVQEFTQSGSVKLSVFITLCVMYV